MSNVHIAIVRMTHPAAVTSIPSSLALAAETIASSGANQTTTIQATAALLAGTTAAATAVGNQAGAIRSAWRVANAGTDNVYVAFGATPNAGTAAPSVTTSRFLLPAGQVAYFAIGAAGDKAAVINA